MLLTYETDWEVRVLCAASGGRTVRPAVLRNLRGCFRQPSHLKLLNISLIIHKQSLRRPLGAVESIGN